PGPRRRAPADRGAAEELEPHRVTSSAAIAAAASPSGGGSSAALAAAALAGSELRSVLAATSPRAGLAEGADDGEAALEVVAAALVAALGSAAIAAATSGPRPARRHSRGRGALGLVAAGYWARPRVWPSV
ncbi:MAG TPA: hypothetical protein VHT91_50645, partial [Kofleriaceae bacterium]|nr:hypothetical protein [Kofleriaceae bacterium]